MHAGQALGIGKAPLKVCVTFATLLREIQLYYLIKDCKYILFGSIELSLPHLYSQCTPYLPQGEFCPKTDLLSWVILSKQNASISVDNQQPQAYLVIYV